MVSLLDEWAARFFEELDYVREGQNATIFAEQMRQDLPQVGRRVTLAAKMPQLVCLVQGCMSHLACCGKRAVCG